MQAWAQVWVRERWLGFLVWMRSGVSGIHPLTLRQTLGPIAGRLPQARQVAGSLNRWLLAVLAERQRLGLVVTAGDEQEEADLLAEDSTQQPYRWREMEQQERWLRWRLVAEVLRLVRLAEAPEEALRRPDWLAWEVRYWAQAVSLARIAQLYAALEGRQGREGATSALEEALALARRQATSAAKAA
jgi:hypothetical protein